MLSMQLQLGLKKAKLVLTKWLTVRVNPYTYLYACKSTLMVSLPSSLRIINYFFFSHPFCISMWQTDVKGKHELTKHRPRKFSCLTRENFGHVVMVSWSLSVSVWKPFEVLEYPFLSGHASPDHCSFPKIVSTVNMHSRKRMNFVSRV